MASTGQRRSPRERWRRRRRRAAYLLVFLLATIGLAWFFELQATTTIVFVRHAETDLVTGASRDPPLSSRGRARAELLANFVEDIDVIAGVDAIYTSPFRRTQQTAQPLAKRLGLEINVADPYNVTEFMKHALREHKGQIVLIVADADAIAPLIEELHGSKNVDIGAGDYDDFYIVTIPWFGKVKTLRLHYGAGWQPAVPRHTSSVAGAVLH